MAAFREFGVAALGILAQRVGIRLELREIYGLSGLLVGHARSARGFLVLSATSLLDSSIDSARP